MGQILRVLRRKGALWATLLFCASLLALRVSAAVEGARYVGHGDEGPVYEHVLNVIDGDDLNPGFFRYPSLPIYLTAGAVVLSNAIFGNQRRKGQPTFSVPRRPGQRYEPERVIRHARMLFAALGGMVFFWVAYLSFRAIGRLHWAWTAPSILALSGVVQTQVVAYQNVDTPMVFFALLTLVVAFHFYGRDHWWGQVLVPGFLAGLTTACKYNAGLVLVPCGLAILLSPQTARRPQKLVALGCAAALGFVVAVPYSLLDHKHFATDVFYEIEHYRNGHPGHEAEPGWDQLSYYLSQLIEDYGAVACTLCLGGATWMLIRDPRRAVVLLSMPVLMLLHMSTNRTHFTRTILPVFAMVPVFAAVGVDGMSQAIERAVDKIKRLRLSKPRAHALAAALTLSLVVTGVGATADPTRLLERNIEPQRRDQALDWLEAELEEGQTVLLADDLWMSNKDLRHYRVIRLAPGLTHWKRQTRKLKKPAVALLPEYGAPQVVPVRMRENEKQRRAYIHRAERNAAKANKNVRRFLESTGATRATTFKGGKVYLRDRLGDRAQSVRNPSIRIYWIR